MPSTDTVEDETKLTPGQEDAAHNDGQHSEIEQPETPGETTGARPKAKGNLPDADGDDPVAENDPLVLARKGLLSDATTKPKTTPKPAADEQPGDDGKPADDRADKSASDQPVDEAKKPKVEDEDPDLSANLSEDAWGKLSHKDKSTFLAIRKTARIKAEEATKFRQSEAKARQEATKFKTDYDAVERFVKDSGLDPDSYRNSVLIAGMVNRGDARAIPLLEESVQRLRKAAGLPDATSAPAPAVDADELAKALEEAETSLDFTTVKQLVGKLKAKPAKTEAQASTQQRPAAPSAAPTAPAAASGYDPAETAVNESIFDYLVENGVQPDQVSGHLKRIISTNPSLVQAPVRERLRAVMRAHSALGSKAQPTPKPIERPISGRGRTAGGGRTNDPQSQDPLVQARLGKMRL